MTISIFHKTHLNWTVPKHLLNIKSTNVTSCEWKASMSTFSPSFIYSILLYKYHVIYTSNLWYSETNLICSMYAKCIMYAYTAWKRRSCYEIWTCLWVVGGLGWFCSMEMIALLESYNEDSLTTISEQLSYNFLTIFFLFYQFNVLKL